MHPLVKDGSMRLGHLRERHPGLFNMHGEQLGRKDCICCSSGNAGGCEEDAQNVPKKRKRSVKEIGNADYFRFLSVENVYARQVITTFCNKRMK